MRLLSDWREILKKAWSIRLIAIGVGLLLLDIGAIVFEAIGLLADRPSLSIALRSLAACCGVAAFIARLIAQSNLSGGD